MEHHQNLIVFREVGGLKEDSLDAGRGEKFNYDFQLLRDGRHRDLNKLP